MDTENARRINQMKKRNLKLSFIIYAICSLLLAVICIIAKGVFVSAEQLFSTLSGVFAIVSVTFLSCLLFLVLKNKYSTRKAIFITLSLVILMTFLFGALMTAIFGMSSKISNSIGAVESLYYYLLGFMIMLISAAAFVITVFVFVLLRILSLFKEKIGKSRNNLT